MQKYAILVSYTGTHFCGWQKQRKGSVSGAPSVQSTIESALFQMTRESVSVVGSGRTDSGVHALGQVAHFVLKEKVWESQILFRGLNSILPQSIQVLAVQKVAIEFHAQHSVVKKQYSYYFQQGPCALPHLEPYSWWIRKTLDQKAMQLGLQSLIGEHDFKPFQASGAKPGPTVRRILEAEISSEPLSFPGRGEIPFHRFAEKSGVSLVRVRIVGTGFLKQMVRGIAGTLLQVGEGRRPSSCFREILESGNRVDVGPTAPARALWMEQVWYPEEHLLEWLKP